MVPAAITNNSSTGAIDQVIPCDGMKLVPTKTTTIPSIQASALAGTQTPAFKRRLWIPNKITGFVQGIPQSVSIGGKLAQIGFW